MKNIFNKIGNISKAFSIGFMKNIHNRLNFHIQYENKRDELKIILNSKEQSDSIFQKSINIAQSNIFNNHNTIIECLEISKKYALKGKNLNDIMNLLNKYDNHIMELKNLWEMMPHGLIGFDYYDLVINMLNKQH